MLRRADVTTTPPDQSHMGEVTIPDISPQDVANKLLSEEFSRSGPVANTLSDPIADTPMVVSLDELRPYELDPRLTRNPLYDEIKASGGSAALMSRPRLYLAPRRGPLHHPQWRQYAPGHSAGIVERNAGRTLFPHRLPVPALA